MQHVIIGTAGHIDHGKTTLIKALTGRETDTLREEKERGISINLGFTYFDLPSKRRAGIIDVPGHEKFIKNMLAGIGGIDIVLLVIAADEGIMPQTREHFNILQLLDIKKGIIVITKKDMVDNEWLNMIKDEVKKEFAETFLCNAPILCVSSVTGEGIKELADTIDNLTNDLENKDINTNFRVPIDRIFSVSGFGTIITGTLISGTINEGDNCEIFTNQTKTKIRNIQVHEENVNSAFAGQRVAINLANVKKDEIKRGDVLASVNSMEVSMMLDCRLKYLKDAPHTLHNRDRIRLHHGTSEIIGRVVVLDKDFVDKGEDALIQIRLESPIAAKKGDKYVIRSYSPMVTIGGGTILTPNPKKHKPYDKDVIEQLLIKEKGDPESILEQLIKQHSDKFPNKESLIKLYGKSSEDVSLLLEKLLLDNKIVKLYSGEDIAFIHNDFINLIKENTKKLLCEFHKNNPLKKGMLKEECKNKIFNKDMKQKLFDAIINLLEVDTIDNVDKYLCIKDYKVELNKNQQAIKSKLLDTFNIAGLQPPKHTDILKGFGREEKAAEAVFQIMIEQNELYKIAEGIYITKNHLEFAQKKLTDFLKANNEITAAQYRDEIGVSRKYAVPILEYFDANKITKRIDDKRILCK